MPGEQIERNFAQAARGGCDFILLNKYACEVKRRAKGKKYSSTWWTQAVQQAEKIGMQPVLFYRFDRKPWYVVTTEGQYESLNDFVATVYE